MLKVSGLEQFQPERRMVELPVAQNGARPVVSFLPVTRAQAFDMLGGIPAAMEKGAQAPQDTTTADKVLKVSAAMDEAERVALALLAAAQTEPRFSTKGSDGSVPWQHVRPENRDALVNAILHASGITGADVRGVRFLDDEAGAADGAGTGTAGKGAANRTVTSGGAA